MVVPPPIVIPVKGLAAFALGALKSPIILLVAVTVVPEVISIPVTVLLAPFADKFPMRFKLTATPFPVVVMIPRMLQEPPVPVNDKFVMVLPDKFLDDPETELVRIA